MRIRERLLLFFLFTGACAHGIFYIYSNSRLVTVVTGNVFIPEFLHHFSRNLYAGTLYPRWLSPLLAGTGAPVFVFYPPLSYYIGSLFHLPETIDPQGTYQLGLAMSFGLLARSLTYYIWLRRHTSGLIAAIIACVFMLEPFNFALMHIQIALAQIWVVTWFPLGLYALERWREGYNRKYLLCFSLILAFIVLTHVPSTLLLAPVLCLYGCYYRKCSWKIALELSGACLLAFGISSIYWLPAALNHYAVQTNHFYYLFSTDNASSFFSPQSYLTAFPIMGAACWVLWLTYIKPLENFQTTVYLFAAIVLGAGFMLFPVSKPLWDSFFPLHLVQLPFRFLSLMLALYPLLLLYLSKYVKLPLWIGIALLTLLPAAFDIADTYDIYRDESYKEARQAIVRSQFELAYCPGEYRTQWMPENISLDYLKTVYAPLAPVQILNGIAEMQVISWKDEVIHLHSTAQTESSIRLKQHFFPGWEARVGDTLLPLRPSESGLMAIDIPTGTHDIDITFSALPGAKGGGILCVLSLFVWGILYIISSYPKPKHAG